MSATKQFLDRIGLTELLNQIGQFLKGKQDVVDHIVVCENTSGTVEDISLDNTSNIFCKIAGAHKDILQIIGTEKYLNSNYTPILLRKSTKRHHRGWHWYRDLGRHGENDITVNIVDETVGGSRENPITAKVVSIGESSPYNLITQLDKHKTQSGETYVSHGKRQVCIKDAQKARYRTFKARWGLAFIKTSDLPSDTNSPIDLSKLVTNIAKFYVYYNWDNIPSNSDSTDSVVLKINLLV